MFQRTRDHAHWLALLLLLLAAWALPLGTKAADASILHLDANGVDYDAWPQIRMLSETGSRLTPAEAIAKTSAFRPPRTPHANLGVRRDAVWLSLEVQLAADAASDWILSIDYPALDLLEIAVVHRGKLQFETKRGRDIAQPEPTRSHFVPLHLQPGERYAVLVRVATTSSMILPIHLVSPARFAAREARIQLIQGLAAGVGLCLVFYALSHGVSLRDPSFFHYAVAAGCMTLFFFTFEGLAAQHLWTGNLWLTRNAAPFLVLVALAGGLLFLEHTLNVAEIHYRFGLAMVAVAIIAGLAAALFALGLIDYRQAQLAATVLGPTPILLGLPAAWLRAREGSRIALYILVGWSAYALGIFVMAALLRGMIPFNDWTQYDFQLGCLSEMVIWVLVLGLRAAEIRQLAETADKERRTLHHLAHTDPLTGLLNRRGLLARLQEEIPQATAERLAAVYLLDLDGFKAVNDQLGHEGGDELLRKVAKRLRTALRSGDVIGRLGGDEFVVLIHDLPSPEDAEQVGSKILHLLSEPFKLEHRLWRLGSTIGYALAPLDEEDPDAALRAADQAMYVGKEAGKNRLERAICKDALADPEAPPGPICAS